MNTAKLFHALNMVLPAVEKKTVIAQYDHFVFHKGHVNTYNGKIFFSHPVDTDIECSVVASDMMEVMKTIDSEEIELVVDENNLLVKSADVEASLSTEIYEDSVVQAITTMNIAGIDWDNKAYPAPSDLIKGIEHCLFNVSKDASDPRNLHNIHVVENVIESGDGYRCSEYIMDSDMDDMLIPASSAVVLCKLDPERYCLTDGWLHFQDAHSVTFSIRLGSGDFPDIGKVIESVESDTMEVALPKELQNVLGKFTNLSDGDLDVYKFVQITIKDGKLLCSTNKETCNIKKNMAYKDESVDIEFFISPVFLSTIMNDTNVIKINSAANAAMFTVSNFTHIITLPIK